MIVLAWILFALTVVSICWWLAVLVRIQRMHASGMSLRRGLAEHADVTAGVSIIIPAHNEERVLDACLTGALAQEWPQLEVIIVLDRCTDASETIARRHAAADPRLKIVRIEACPPSWAGKCNALRQAAESATSDWLLFLDADTTADPRMTRALVAEATRRDAALLSLLPDLDCSAWFERVSQPVASMALGQMFPPDRTNRDRGRPFANGQCMLFQRAWYQAIDGHVAVHEDLLEDLAFATKIREAGGNVRVLRANGLLACSMYGDWSAFRRGWTRIFLEAAGRRPAALRKFAIRQEVIGTLPPVCMIGGGIVGGLMHMPLVWGAAAVLFVLQLAALSTVYAMAKQPLWCTLLFPFGCFEVGRAQRRAARLLNTRRPVKWGGKEYVLEPR